jgi:hypothetical protein
MRFIKSISLLILLHLHTYAQDDTTFIINKGPGKYGNVYIINNRSSECYNWLPGFVWSEFDTLEYRGTVNTLKKNPTQKLKKHDMKGLPQNWYEMKYYNGKFYTYISDANEVVRYQVNDSTIIIYQMDAPLVWGIVSVKKVSSKHYQIKMAATCTYGPQINGFELIGYTSYPCHHDTSDLNIYIIDSENNVIVFDFSGEYTLMISADKVRTYPAIVNIDMANRVPPFEGGNRSIDFPKLLRSKGFELK